MVFVGFLSLLSIVIIQSTIALEYKEIVVFEDNFSTLDFNKWRHDLTMGGGGNWEFQWYTNNRKNSFVKNNTLYLKPSFTAEYLGSEDSIRTGRHEIWGASPANECTGNAWWGCERTVDSSNILNPIMSARLTTVESFSFKYGRVEVVAKLPKGDWLWPAIWLLPQHNTYGEWPASGEIDIMESRGNSPSCVDGSGNPLGNNQYSSAMHWGPKWNQNAYSLTNEMYQLENSQTFNDQFHTFGLLWSEDSFTFYVDDEDNAIMVINRTDFWQWGVENGIWSSNEFNPWQYSSTSNAPFDHKFYIVLNNAVGGTTGFFPDSVCNKPWSNGQAFAQTSFYNAKSQWLPTWQDSTSGYGTYAVSDNAALQIKSVKVTELVK